MLRRLLQEMGRDQLEPMVMFEDNAACIHSSQPNAKPFGQRSKHIDTRVFKLKEFVSEGILELAKISTEDVSDCVSIAIGIYAMYVVIDQPYAIYRVTVLVSRVR